MLLRQLLTALHADSPAPARRYRGSIGLHDAGELVELLAKPEPTRCPHCNRQQPPVQLRTRRRRLYELRAPGGQLLHYEIEP
jgi:hypothetical protein